MGADEGGRARLARRLRVGWLPEQLAARYGVPLIVIGMHRSGTSLVTRLLRACGGFFGSDLEHNSEPFQMIRLNSALLSLWGARWQRVPADFEERRLAGHAAALRAVRRRLDWLRVSLFDSFGEPAEERECDPLRMKPRRLPAFALRWPAPQTPVEFWGWKDPRNTLTLPVWFEFFPGARVLHVVRNGIDVTRSLRARADSHGIGVPECRELDHCFDLWERYVEEACRWRSLPANRYCEIRYEDLLADPASELPRLLAFAGGEVARGKAADVLELCRAPAPRGRPEPELLERAQKSTRLRELGYSG